MKNLCFAAIAALLGAVPRPSWAQEPVIEWDFQRQQPPPPKAASLQERWASPFAVQSVGRAPERTPRVVTVIRDATAAPRVAAATPDPAPASPPPTTPAPTSPSPTPTPTPSTGETAPRPPAPSSGASAGRVLHLVKRGDTLSEIAAQYGVSEQAIIAANRMDDKVVRLGQRLIIPGGAARAREPRAAAAAPPPSPDPADQPYRTLHQVRRGDTLLGIARRYGVSQQAIIQANRMDDDVVRIGQRLIIPAGRLQHEVKRGDTLLGIARQYGVSQQAIIQANGMDDEVVRIGQRLIIPVAGQQ